MPRQRRRGVGVRGVGVQRRGGRSASVANSDTSVDGKQHCGSCSKEVLDGCIGCDRCETWVHGTEMCAGLPAKVIEAILEHDGQGINYFCLKCCIARASELEKSHSKCKDDLSSGTLAQLFQQMQGLCSAVAELAAQVKALSSPPPSTQGSVAHQHPLDTHNTTSADTYAAVLTRHPNTTAPSPEQTSQNADYRQIVRQELRELHEREKRKESVVIHGLKSTSTRGVGTEFGELTQQMMGKHVELTDILPIPGHAGLYRGKILNESDRKLVLDKAKTLKGTNYDRVFIRRDLTYNQRCALKARRDAYHAEQNLQAPATASGPGERHMPSPQEPGVPKRPRVGSLTSSAEEAPPGCEPGAVEGRDGGASAARKPAASAPSCNVPTLPTTTNSNSEPPQSN